MKDFNRIWDIYEKSFPEDERRSIELQKKILKNPKYEFRPLYDNEKIIGLLAKWDLDDFIFVDHFAIDERYRGKGYGKKFIKELLEKSNKIVVLEVEKPETIIAKKRIEFYERLNFHLNHFSYNQPAYGENKKPVPLLIMTYPEPLDEDGFMRIKGKLYKDVYK